VALAPTSTVAQSPVSGIFFTDGFEGGLGSSFNSRYYGGVEGSQFRLDTATRASGSASLRHAMSNGLAASAIQYATQHFGDAINGPVHPAGRGQHFNDLYIQYKIYYSPGFDLAAGKPKQLI